MPAVEVRDDVAADDLSGLLDLVAGDRWGSAAGRQAIRLMRSPCRREAALWNRKAGWLTDEVGDGVGADGPAGPGEPVRRRPGLLRVAVRRVYAPEAAAQTGMGSASTRG